MSIQYHSSEENARNTWNALCAKNGLPEACNIGPNVSGLNQNDLHEIRKTARRALNKITDSLKPTDYDNATSDAITFAGSVVSAVNQQFERQQDANHFFGKKQSNSILRTAADFENHYQSRAKNTNDDPFDLADYLRGIANMKTTPTVKNALSVGTDTGGGYAVPGVLMPGILGAMLPASSLLSAGAGIVPLEDGAKNFTTAQVAYLPVAAWREEAGALAVSDPAFKAVIATPQSLSFMFKVSRELLADAVGLNEALNQVIAQSFALELDRVGLRGTGTAPEPRGIKNTVGTHAVSNGVNGGVISSYNPLFTGLTQILQADGPVPTAAIMSPRSLVNFGSLVDTSGQPLNTPNMLKNLKMISTSQIPNTLTVGTSTDCSEIYLGDFSNMYFAMRESVSIQLLQELYAGTGEIGFACHVRADVVLNYPQSFAVISGVR